MEDEMTPKKKHEDEIPIDTPIFKTKMTLRQLCIFILLSGAMIFVILRWTPLVEIVKAYIP